MTNSNDAGTPRGWAKTLRYATLWTSGIGLSAKFGPKLLPYTLVGPKTLRYATLWTSGMGLSAK